MSRVIDGIGISESRLAIDDEATFITFGCLELFYDLFAHHYSLHPGFALVISCSF